MKAQILIQIALLQAIPATATPQRLYERVLIQPSRSSRTVKPVVMGTHYAVSSMMPQATVAAQRILEAGGNAFDAHGRGQAAPRHGAPSSQRACHGRGRRGLFSAPHKRVALVA